MDIKTLKQKTGTQMGTSSWYVLDQERINQFAAITEDQQFIHIDKERAAATPFGTTIAHGFLTLSLLPAMGRDVIPELDGHLMSVNYGFEKLRFLSPVPSGKRVRGHFTLTSLEERKLGEVTMLWDISIEIEGQEKPALYAQWLNRRYIKV
jgi:acyl dehydratase